MPARQLTPSKSFLRSPFKIGVLLAVVAAIVVAVVLVNNGRHHASKAVSGTIKTMGTSPATNTPGSSPSATTTTPSQAAGSSNKSPTASQRSPVSSLAAPYGSFVSNHKPGQNGSNLTELSQCDTTAGASCHITFTQGSVTKTLAAQTVGADGTTFWEWNVNDAGLTSGEWTITAVASLNGETKSTTDQLKLEVQ